MLTNPGVTSGSSLYQSCTKSDGHSGVCVDQCIKAARPSMPDPLDYADNCPKTTPGMGTRCLVDQTSNGVPSARAIADMVLRCY